MNLEELAKMGEALKASVKQATDQMRRALSLVGVSEDRHDAVLAIVQEEGYALVGKSAAEVGASLDRLMAAMWSDEQMSAERRAEFKRLVIEELRERDDGIAVDYGQKVESMMRSFLGDRFDASMAALKEAELLAAPPFEFSAGAKKALEAARQEALETLSSASGISVEWYKDARVPQHIEEAIRVRGERSVGVSIDDASLKCRMVVCASVA
jgi:hypothetical protein